jgi:hypothetical protein
MASPYSNLQSKLERAIVAYLISKQCGTAADIFPFESVRTRSFPNTTVDTAIAVPDPLGSGNYRIPTLTSVKGSAAVAPGAVNPAAPRMAFDARVALTGDMLAQTDNQEDLKATAVDITTIGRALAVDASNGADPVQVQIAANNADMADFTIHAWFERGFGKTTAKDDGCAWEIVILHEAVCCASAIN